MRYFANQIIDTFRGGLTVIQIKFLKRSCRSHRTKKHLLFWHMTTSKPRAMETHQSGWVCFAAWQLIVPRAGWWIAVPLVLPAYVVTDKYNVTMAMFQGTVSEYGLCAFSHISNAPKPAKDTCKSNFKFSCDLLPCFCFGLFLLIRQITSNKLVPSCTFLGLRAAAVARGGWPDVRLGGGICLGGGLRLGAGVCFRREVCEGWVVWSQWVLPRTLVPILDGLRRRLQGQSWKTESKIKLITDETEFTPDRSRASSTSRCHWCFES